MAEAQSAFSACKCQLAETYSISQNSFSAKTPIKQLIFIPFHTPHRKKEVKSQLRRAEAEWDELTLSAAGMWERQQTPPNTNKQPIHLVSN